MFQVAPSIHGGADITNHHFCPYLASLDAYGSGVARMALGSVAERVIQHTTIPILLMDEQTAIPRKKIERILVSLDGSTFAKQAYVSCMHHNFKKDRSEKANANFKTQTIYARRSQTHRR